MHAEKMGERRRSSILVPLLAVLQIAFAEGQYAGLPQKSRDTAVYFHRLNDSACTREKVVQVTIEGYAEVALRLRESSRDFLAADSPADSQWATTVAGDLTARRPCYYQGEAVASGGRAGGGDLAVAKLSHDGLFSATFHHNGLVYEVPPQPHSDSQPGRALLNGRRLPPPAGPKRRCPLASAGSGGPGRQVRGRRSALAVDTRSEVAQAARKFVQMVLVGDEAFYKAFGSVMTKAQDKLWEIGNYVNSLYKQLGTSVIIVRAIVWTSDPYTLVNKTSTINSIEMLEKFMAYRMQNLSDVPHNVAHLVSGLRMSGSDVGLAHLGKLCQYAFGGAVNSDNDITGNAINVAVTVAHELGHNLGMNHDEDDVPCSCPDPQGCIMKAVGGEVNPLRFSTCSVNRFLEFTVPSGLGYCMSRQPDASVRPASEAPPRCGNRVVEPGEDCDCGPASWCNNSCCNPSTCKFAPGATCASGQCCNIATCALTARGAECRAARGPCDLPEVCNGSSEWCPEFDDFLIDGTPCAPSAAGTLAYCHLGECDTRDGRCESVFNWTGYRSAPEHVYNATLEARGGDSGYCSYRAVAHKPVSYEFQECTYDNRRCGTLYCIGTGSDSYPTPKWKSMSPADARSFSLSLGGSTLDVAFARLDLRPSGVRDPGMVPNGAECGAGMMCVDSRCLTVASVRDQATAGRSLPNCNGNGRLAQSVQCYCNSGYRPPDCLLPGAGGSATNQPAFSLPNATATTPSRATTTTYAGIGLSSTTRGSLTPTTPANATATTPSRATTTTYAGIGLSSTTRGSLTSTTPGQAPQDNYWLYVGIGIAAGIVFLMLVVGLSVLLWCWCRRRGASWGSFVGKNNASAKSTSLSSRQPGLVQGPPAHLAEFYESLRRTDYPGSWKGRRYWPTPKTDSVDNSQMA